MSEMCCKRLAENAGRKNRQKIAIWSPGHHRTTLSDCIFATKACIDNRKKPVKQQYLFHTYTQYGELRLANGIRSVGEFGASQEISTGFATWLRYCIDIAQRRSTKLARRLAVSWAGTLYIHFWGLLPLNGILPGAKFT